MLFKRKCKHFYKYYLVTASTAWGKYYCPVDLMNCGDEFDGVNDNRIVIVIKCEDCGETFHKWPYFGSADVRLKKPHKVNEQLELFDN